MSNRTSVTELLAAALTQAADVARTRLNRNVAVVEASELPTSSILRFDLPFATGGRLSWYVANEDATGFSDILIGGVGDTSAVLTEMHLDALTVAFSDMLTRTVETVAASLDEPVEAADIDLGMESELPPLDPGAQSIALALEIEGYGHVTVVQYVDAELARIIDEHIVAEFMPAATSPSAAAAPDAASADTTPAPESVAPNNVVQLPTGPDLTIDPVVAAKASGDLDMLMNVPLPITVELGRAQRTIRELVDFTVGSIIELGKLAGDPLDIMVNDRVIARGEVVVIDEEFGVRLTEIVSPEDRLRGIG